MALIDHLQTCYDMVTVKTEHYNERTSLAKMAFCAALPGYIGGSVVQYHFPLIPVSISPLGCAVGTMTTIPAACGCAFIAYKLSGLIHEKLQPYATVIVFVKMLAIWPIFNALAFSSRPLLAGTILVVSLAVTLVADVIFGKKQEKEATSHP